MKRILYCSTFLYPSIGGGSKSMIPLLRALSAEGNEVFCVNGGPVFNLSHEINLYDDGYWALITHTPVERARFIIEKYHPDMLITQGYGSVEAIELARHYGIKTVLFIIDLFLFTPDASPFPLNTDYAKNLEVYRQADTIISNSEFTRDKVRELTGRSSEVVYPIILPDDYVIAGNRESSHITLASAQKIKGIDILLGQAAQIGSPCLVCGELERGYEARLASANIGYMGNIKDMRQLYKKSKCHLVLSQVPEAFGRTIVEANMNGIPVVGYNIGAIPEVVGTGGVIINSPEELPGAVEKALRITPEQCRENARRFDAQAQIEKVRDLL